MLIIFFHMCSAKGGSYFEKQLRFGVFFFLGKFKKKNEVQIFVFSDGVAQGHVSNASYWMHPIAAHGPLKQ